MKINKIFSLLFLFLLLVGCSDLDLNPLSEGSSENWYSNETEIEMSLNDLFRHDFWFQDYDDWTDDWESRGRSNQITGATINANWSTLRSIWRNHYKAISRSNVLLEKLKESGEFLSEKKIAFYEANAKFCRASRYAYLISHCGDVPYITADISIDEAFTLSRTDKNTILETIYEDYDYASTVLPVSYASGRKYATKGACHAMKARIALYMEDYTTARDEAKKCIDLGVYDLHPSFEELFLTSTKKSPEIIFSIPRSAELNEVFASGTACANYYTRNAGGYAARNPSWQLFSAFLCSDGLPIDESPLYNPREPFKNRDPRCTMTIVEFGTEFLGFIYEPHPDSLKVWSFDKNSYVTNQDTRSNGQYASYNGLVFRKGINKEWSDDKVADQDKIIIRYADILLMYAEAKIELNEIDESVLKAINQVRARAYNVDVSDVGAYPAVTTINQSELRKALRIERRMEFAPSPREGIRYMDIIRWKIAGKVLNQPTYGMLDVKELREKVVNKGLWFFPGIPEIDEYGVANFDPMFEAGLIKLLGVHAFDESKQYLWPIPASEVEINPNITQNPGY
jgi:hypothetical protein